MVCTKVKLVMGGLLRTMKQIKRGKNGTQWRQEESVREEHPEFKTGLCWPAQKGGREPTPDSKLSPWTTAVRSQQWSGHFVPKARQRGETFKCSKACS